MKKMDQGMKLNTKSWTVLTAQLLVHMLTRSWIELLNVVGVFYFILFWQ